MLIDARHRSFTPSSVVLAMSWTEFPNAWLRLTPISKRPIGGTL